MSNRRSLLATFVGLLYACTAIAADKKNAPPPDATSILFRWCERNADAQSARVEFRQFVYDETFKCQKLSTGVLHIDRQGSGMLSVFPVQPLKKRHRGYVVEPDSPRHWEWTPDLWRSINHEHREFSDTIRPTSGDPKTKSFAWSWFNARPSQWILFVPGLVPRTSLADFHFSTVKWTKDEVFVHVKPTTSPEVPLNFTSAELVFSREPVELLAVQYHSLVMGHRTVHVFEVPEVEPIPEPFFDLMGYRNPYSSE
jgi:hypothetical protein